MATTLVDWKYVLQGYLRATADIDIVLALESKNVVAAVKTLEQLDYVPRPPVPFTALANVQQRQLWIKEKGLTVVTVAAIPDLIEMKSKVGRPQDLQDIEALQKLQESERV